MTERNPSWARDEVILALNLYIQHRHPLPPVTSREISELSQILNALPIHTSRPDRERFRNDNGVALKLANFSALDPQYPGRGMVRGSAMDREVWDR